MSKFEDVVTSVGLYEDRDGIIFMGLLDVESMFNCGSGIQMTGPESSLMHTPDSPDNEIVQLAAIGLPAHSLKTGVATQIRKPESSFPGVQTPGSPDKGTKQSLPGAVKSHPYCENISVEVDVSSP
jgi:hypothetical protein